MKNANNLGKQSFSPLPAYAIVLSFVLSNIGHAQQILPTVSDVPQTQSASSTPLVTPSTPSTQPENEANLLQEASEALSKGATDSALTKVNQVIAVDTQSKESHMLRASIYANQKQWDKADYDYQVVLTIDPAFSPARFDMAELKFMQKKYDEARVGFASLENDKDFGDFATYKAFLCDLFGAHEDAAAKDLDALNQIGGNPSYYFGNAAWDLVHNKPADAADWLKSASRIYSDSPNKFANYTRSLTSLGYLPLPTDSAQ